MSAVLKPYMPRRNSLAGRVVEFFQRNPDEELTRKDVADKFGFTLHAVDTGLQAAVDAGLLCKAKSADSTVVWCCGLRGKTNTPKGDQPRSERGREVMEPGACESATGRGTVGAPALATLPHYASPGGGPMGVGQPAAAGPTGGRVEVATRLNRVKASSAAAVARTAKADVAAYVAAIGPDAAHQRHQAERMWWCSDGRMVIETASDFIEFQADEAQRFLALARRVGAA